MDWRHLWKAFGAAIGGAAGGAGTVAVLLPEGVTAPWWGYILVAAANAAIAGFAAYVAPRNVYQDEERAKHRARQDRVIADEVRAKRAHRAMHEPNAMPPQPGPDIQNPPV